MDEYLNKIYWNNKVLDYAFVIGAILIAWVVLQIIKKSIIATLRKLTGRSKTTVDDILIAGFEKFIIPYIYLLINFAIINQLKLSAGINRAIDVAIAMVTVYFGARFINHALHTSLKFYLTRRGEGPSRILQMNGILNIFKVLVWGIGLLFLLDNLGYQVTTIITGLGIGGIAIALAAQNILSDLFSYFVIFFDKPFEIGDFVVAGDKSGTIEQIGIKTSRVRTLSGEELVMPNAELVKTPIHNFKKMATRRVLFAIQVTYDTPTEQLKEISTLLKDIVTSEENIRFDRAHLQGLGDYSINYEVVYIVLSADYNIFMNIHQSICIKIIDAFRSRGMEFAYPTQVILSASSGNAEKTEELKSEIILK